MRRQRRVHQQHTTRSLAHDQTCLPMCVCARVGAELRTISHDYDPTTLTEDPAQSHALSIDRFDRFISLCGGRCWWSPHTHSHARTNPENSSSAKRKNHTRYNTHEETRRSNLHDHSHAPTIDRFCSFVGHLSAGAARAGGVRACRSLAQKSLNLGFLHEREDQLGCCCCG